MRKSERERERERPFLLVFVTVLHRFRKENSNVYTSLSIGFNVYNMPLLRMREDLRKIYSHRIYFVLHFLKQGDGKFKSIYCIIFFSFSEF